MKRIWGAWCLLLMTATFATAAGADQRLIDCKLAVKARHALLSDEDLGLWNLGVSVRDRQATVWGQVPSASLARRACERVRQVPGIAEVVNEIRVSMERAPDEPWLHGTRSVSDPLRFEPPFPARRDPPGVTLQPIWMDTDQPLIKNVEERKQKRVTPVVRLPEQEPAERLKEETPKHSITQDSTHRVADAVLELCRRDERFRHIHPDVKNGCVFLNGLVRNWEDVHVLAKDVSRLPGVERVILGDLRRR